MLIVGFTTGSGCFFINEKWKYVTKTNVAYNLFA